MQKTGGLCACMGGKAKGETETHERYNEKKGERNDTKRPGTKMKYSGLNFKDGTENSEYREHEGNREKYERRSDNIDLPGGAEGDTETQDRYSAKKGERYDPKKQGTKMQYGGLDLKNGTEHGQYRKHEGRREYFEKRGDN